jgi:hypothetical protein
MIAGWNPFLFKKNTGFTSSTFPIQQNFLQNQPAAITLYTGSPQTMAGHQFANVETWEY